MGMRTIVISATVLLAAEAGGANAGAQHPTAFEHSFASIDGSTLELSQWRGKALLVVNTASFCGFTKQYEGLQRLWERYEAKGLVVIGVPSNDFGGQEPNSEAEIKSFCQGAFGVTFPLTAKYEVKGANAHAFYKWAVDALGPKAQPQWNFHKLLIARDGRAVAAYPSGIEPLSITLIEAIERELAR